MSKARKYHETSFEILSTGDKFRVNGLEINLPWSAKTAYLSVTPDLVVGAIVGVLANHGRAISPKLHEEIRDEVCYYIRVFGNLSEPKRANLDEGCGTRRKAA